MRHQGIVVSELFHHGKHTEVDGAAASHCYNRCIFKAGIIISGFDCMWTRPSKCTKIKDTAAGIGSYDSTPYWSEN